MAMHIAIPGVGYKPCCRLLRKQGTGFGPFSPILFRRGAICSARFLPDFCLMNSASAPCNGVEGILTGTPSGPSFFAMICSLWLLSAMSWLLFLIEAIDQIVQAVLTCAVESDFFLALS